MKHSAKSIRDEHGLFVDRTILNYNKLDCEAALDYLIQLRLMYISTAWMEDNAINTGMPLKGTTLNRHTLVIPGVTNCVGLLCSREEQNLDFVKRQRHLPLTSSYSKNFIVPATFKENSTLEYLCNTIGNYIINEGYQVLDIYRYETLINYLLNYKRGILTPKLDDDLVTQLFNQLNLLKSDQYHVHIVTISDKVMTKLRYNKGFNDALNMISIGHQQNLYRYKDYLFSVVPDYVLQLHYTEVLPYRKGRQYHCYHPLNIHWIVTPIDDIYAPTVQLPLIPSEQEGKVHFYFQIAHCIYMLDTALNNSFVSYAKVADS